MGKSEPSNQRNIWLIKSILPVKSGRPIMSILRIQMHIKGSPEGSSDQEFRSSILCDVIENS